MSKRNRGNIYRTGELGSNQRLPRTDSAAFSYVFGTRKGADFLPGPVALRVSGPRIFRPPAPIRAAQGTARPFSYLLSALRISAPKRVYFCVARKSRREVLHALNIAGRRGIGRRGVRRREESNYKC